MTGLLINYSTEMGLLGSSSSSPGTSGSNSQRTRAQVLELFPSREEVDFLIQHFIDKINFIYDYITPDLFLERYGSWWSQSSYYGEEDIVFGVLILRLCVYSLQFLPHHDYPTDSVLDYPIDVLESRCDEAAYRLDSYRPRKPSVFRIQYLMLQTVTLMNAGDPKESYQALREGINEAHEINLFTEERWPTVHDSNAETRRKVFWNVYIWDR